MMHFLAMSQTINQREARATASVLRRWRSALVVFFLFATALPAAEVSSNGAGGGLWSEPSTWRGNAAPKPEDEVTIRKGDVVVFDRNDDGKTTCHKLFIDPQGVLKFKTEAGKITFTASGPIESFGLVKLDGTKSANDIHELVLTGKTVKERIVTFQKGGALVASAKANLAGGKRNIRIVSKAPDPKAADVTGKVDAQGGTTLDVQHCELEHTALSGTDIDNTGARPNERVNLLGNRFLGHCNILLYNCDTPIVTDNVFDYIGGPWHQPAAIYLNGCPLAEVKNNIVRGSFYYAFSLYSCTDCVVVGNLSAKTYMGYYCVGSAMFKGNTVREAVGGLWAPSMTGTLEDCVFEKCGYAVALAGGTVQMTNCAFKDPPKDSKALEFTAGAEVTLINCAFGPDQVRLPKMLPKVEKPFVTALHFLILKINGEVPDDALVDIRTLNPASPIAPGAQDLNVRNAPAPLIGNRTPLPQSLSPVILKAWVIDKDGKTVAAPDYTVRVLGPTDGVKERQVFATLKVKPVDTWFRPKPNDPAPTVEVKLK